MSLFAFSLYCATMLNPHISVTQENLAVDYMGNLKWRPQPEDKVSFILRFRTR